MEVAAPPLYAYEVQVLCRLGASRHFAGKVGYPTQALSTPRAVAGLEALHAVFPVRVASVLPCMSVRGLLHQLSIAAASGCPFAVQPVSEPFRAFFSARCTIVSAKENIQEAHTATFTADHTYGDAV